MKRRTRWTYLIAGLALAAGVLLFLFLPGGSRVTPRVSPNVLLVSIDTLRADHLGTYGAKVATPTLDWLAAEGVLFERAVSHVPLTLPSHASLLTGIYPIAHGVRERRLPPRPEPSHPRNDLP